MRVTCETIQIEDGRWMSYVKEDHNWKYDNTRYFYGDTPDEALLRLRKGLEEFERSIKKTNETAIISIIDIEV